MLEDILAMMIRHPLLDLFDSLVFLSVIIVIAAEKTRAGYRFPPRLDAFQCWRHHLYPITYYSLYSTN